jgi:hypothetical protein
MLSERVAGLISPFAPVCWKTNYLFILKLNFNFPYVVILFHITAYTQHFGIRSFTAYYVFCTFVLEILIL